MLEIHTYTGGFAATNGYLVENAEGSFIVDAPEGMEEWLIARKAQVRALLLTHAHFDHVLDAADIQRRFQCPILAFAHSSMELTLEDLLGAMGGSFQVPPYKADQLLSEGPPASVLGLEFQVAHIPGHSPDSLSFYFASDGIVFTGDTLMSGGMGRCDFPGGSESQLISGIRSKLYSLPAETRIYPGHGPSSTIGMQKRLNPYVRP